VTSKFKYELTFFMYYLSFVAGFPSLISIFVYFY